MVPLAAQEDPPPIATEFLTTRSVFTHDVDLLVRIKPDGERTTVVREEDPSRTIVARFTVQPGAQFPWHSHAGALVVNMVEGRLTYIEEGCDEREYTAGRPSLIRDTAMSTQRATLGRHRRYWSRPSLGHRRAGRF
jgi:quercetin dioxygenase-like cupin family protein